MIESLLEPEIPEVQPARFDVWIRLNERYQEVLELQSVLTERLFGVVISAGVIRCYYCVEGLVDERHRDFLSGQAAMRGLRLRWLEFDTPTIPDDIQSELDHSTAEVAHG